MGASSQTDLATDTAIRSSSCVSGILSKFNDLRQAHRTVNLDAPGRHDPQSPPEGENMPLAKKCVRTAVNANPTTSNSSRQVMRASRNPESWTKTSAT